MRKWYIAHKDLQNARSKRWRETHKERQLELCKIWRANNKERQSELEKRWREENYKQILARSRQYHKEHREERIAYSKRWREEHPEYLAKNRQWKAEHPETRSIYRHNYDARIKGNGGAHTLEELNMLFVSQNYLCYYCNKPFFDNTLNAEYHIDHKIPVSKGGTNNIDNIAISCPSCNLSKYNKTADQFLMVGK